MRIAISDRSPLTYVLDGKQLNVSQEKDLGIMKFHQHTASVAAPKASHILGIISKSFEYLDIDSLPKSLVCPVNEYANSIWGPFHIDDQRKFKNMLSD